MNFNKYQELAHKTAVYPEEFGTIYPALGLAGEAGELANKVKKYFIRDRNPDGVTPEQVEALQAELGDVLWYVAEVATTLGLSLEDVAIKNIDKLLFRQEWGLIKGDGDTR